MPEGIRVTKGILHPEAAMLFPQMLGMMAENEITATTYPDPGGNYSVSNFRTIFAFVIDHDEQF